MIWSSKVAKPSLRDRLLDSLELKGDEKVLDVGCGRGLLLIGIAKRLKSGKATGIDVWSHEDLSGNSADATKANAKARRRLGKSADRERATPGSWFIRTITTTWWYRASRSTIFRIATNALKRCAKCGGF